eukprot:GEMP01037618.1.p1 GENE.GEMP01037618.1~~GEMP01037618.1.p1  ORF type:complete len:434 (+),score=113.89 GEMP01037618.1:27-1328(+)
MSADFSAFDVTMAKRSLTPPDDRAAICRQNNPCALRPTWSGLEAPALYSFSLLTATLSGENGELAVVPESHAPVASRKLDVTPSLFTNVKLDLGETLDSVSNKCECCTVAGGPLPTSFPEVPLVLPGLRKYKPGSTAASFAEELWESFGTETLAAILAPDVTPDEVHQLGEGGDGLNHIFIAKVRSWFVKAVMFESAANSEAQQMEHLKQTCPTMLTDPTLIFPVRWCRVENGECRYDVIVYPYVKGMNVRELVTAFEESTKPRKARLWPAMVTLMRSCAQILRQYHITHERKHGDAKADNFMVTQDGRILLCDLGVNVLTMCEKQEFTRSIVSEDPEVTQLKGEFADTFDAAVGTDICDSDRAQIRSVMRQLTQQCVDTSMEDTSMEGEGLECSRAPPTPLSPKRGFVAPSESLWEKFLSIGRSLLHFIWLL